MSGLKVTIGLEIHVQLKTKSKMFCSCDNDAEDKAPNTVVCPVCMGMPGVLPVPNRQAVEWAILLGKYLGGKISKFTKFDRKHYFYPDLPRGYQISQYDQPIIKGGKINIDGTDIHLERIHMEEDAGKLTHLSSGDYSLVDLNRAGTPLLEVVTKPEITSPQQAKKFVQRLRLIVRYLGISNANMEKGHLRCDANISITKNQISNRKNQNNGVVSPQIDKDQNGERDSSATVGMTAIKLGTPVEIKNLNSFLMIERALKYEISRQSELLSSGEKVVKETRGWDDKRGKTLPQRTKELAPDYRYFPEPDIPPLVNIEQEFNTQLPESIEEKINIAKEIGLKQNDIDLLTKDDKLLRQFDKIKNQTSDPILAKKAVDIVINFEKSRQLDTDFIIDLAGAIMKGEVGAQSIRLIIEEGLRKNASVDDVIKTGGYRQVSDVDVINKAVDDVIKNNGKVVEDIRAGKDAAMKFLIGQVMRETKGQANPEMVQKLLREKIK